MAARFLNWKVILLFSLGIVCGLAFIMMFIPSNPASPTLPDELFIQAQAMRLNEEMESRWQDRIASASKAGSENQDKSLAAIFDEALAGGAYKAACATASLMKNRRLADKLLAELIGKASAECKSLPWAAAAFSDLTEKEHALAAKILERWQECNALN